MAALKVLVNAALPCGTTSSITTAVSRATAGVATSFDVRVNDAYGNVLDTVYSAVYVSASPQNALSSPAIGFVIPTTTGVTQADPGGRYTATYTITRSGSYWVSAAVVDQAAGGLTATVVDDTGTVINSRIDSNISCCSSWALPWETGRLRV